MKIASLTIFILAVAHTFLVKYMHRFARTFPERSTLRALLFFLSEIELIFGFWSVLMLAIMLFTSGSDSTISYLESRSFAEPIFVFVIISLCSTRPIHEIGEKIVLLIANLIPLKKQLSIFISTLFIGPLLGSIITEPAAMTITSILLLEHFFKQNISTKFKYAILGALFVNISIGGILTPYAAPPILMVASKWNLTLTKMLSIYGWRGALACLTTALAVTYQFRKELSKIQIQMILPKKNGTNLFMRAIYLFILIAIVTAAHYPIIVLGLFLFFLGFTKITNTHSPTKLKSGLLVAFFLAGLTVLCGQQTWWLTPIIEKMSDYSLYFGTICLTAITDNAALTYLGSLVPNLNQTAQYFLLSGAVVGGGLTVIANAPNPIGYNLLQQSFGQDGISPLSLFRYALLPTLIAAAFFAINL